MYSKILLLWIYCLTFTGGMVNTVCVAYFATTVSHFTGVVSRFATHVAALRFRDMGSALALMGAFLLGGAVSGFIVHEREFNLKKRYGIILLFTGAALALANALTAGRVYPFMLFLAFLMGLQNGLLLRYNGVVVRTTHMSGNLTDLGVYLGYFLRDPANRNHLEKALISLFCILFFAGGGVFGMLLYPVLGRRFFYVTALFYWLIAAFYFRIRHLRLRGYIF